MTRTGSSSPTTERARALVAEREDEACALGASLATQIDDPPALEATLRAGLDSLADPEYRAGQRRVAPGIGPVAGVRAPLLQAVGRGFDRATRGVPVAQLLWVADRLTRAEISEIRWFGCGMIARILPRDPERSWQLIRRTARTATEWITIDTLAHLAAQGILAEPYRWAEIEQLVYSPSRWERRLVGSTIATMPFEGGKRGRQTDVARRGLELIGVLIGDAEPDVQKALSWALRSLTLVDRSAVADFCERESVRTLAEGDGHRAWVIRDALGKLTESQAAPVRDRLAGLRRANGAPSTSTAARSSDLLTGLPPASALPEPPLR